VSIRVTLNAKTASDTPTLTSDLDSDVRIFSIRKLSTRLRHWNYWSNFRCYFIRANVS